MASKLSDAELALRDAALEYHRAPTRGKISAHLLVPNALSSDELRRRLGAVASEMMVDIALGDRAG